MSVARVEEVSVELGPRSYQILVGGALLQLTGPRLAALGIGTVRSRHQRAGGKPLSAQVEASLRAAGSIPR